MTTLKIRDPYERTYTVKLDEGIPKEDLQEILDFLDSNTREIWALEAKERYYQKYSMDALTYEGVEYADTETPEDILLRKEEEPNPLDELNEDERLEFYLSQLTETQQRRIRLRRQDLNFEEIAEAEDMDSSSVRESVYAVPKRLRKLFPKRF